MLFRRQVLRERLGWYLAELCHQFYAQLDAPAAGPDGPPAPLTEDTPTAGAAPLPRCPRCLTVYDATYGDPAQGIVAGTPWAALGGYRCPTCEAPATAFEWWHEPADAGADWRVTL